MTMLVHVTPEKNGARIKRSGIAAASTGRLGDSGLYCMPVLPSYELTYQWVRELRRGGQRTVVAVHFRVDDDEKVTVGRYSDRSPARMTAAKAAALIRRLDDPRGYEIFVPRPISAAQVHRIRQIPQGIGWRFLPNAHGRRPCACPACLQRGEYKAADIRARLSPEPPRRPRPELLAALREATAPDDIIELLWALGGRRRADAHELAFLVDHPDPDVREELAEQLRNYRGRTARDLLARLG